MLCIIFWFIISNGLFWVGFFLKFSIKISRIGIFGEEKFILILIIVNIIKRVNLLLYIKFLKIKVI